MSMVKNEDFKIIKGEEKLKLYTNFIQKLLNIIFVPSVVFIHITIQDLILQ